MLRRALCLAAIASVLVACACAVALAAAAPQVKVGDDFFATKHLTVGRGARVTWRWTGVLSHNVTVRSGPVRFHSRTQARGSFSHVFTRAGTYTLYCTIRPFMKMTVVVR